MGQLVPKSLDPDARWNKGTILKAAVDYIHSLQKEQSRIRQAEMQAQEMDSVNKQLKMRIQQLETGFQHNGLTIPAFDPNGMHGRMEQMQTPFNPTPSQPTFTTGDTTGNYSLHLLSPNAGSTGVMTVHPHSSNQVMGQMQSNGSPVTTYLSPQQPHFSQQHIIGNRSNLSPQRNHQMSPNISNNHFCFPPDPNVMSPHNPMRHLSETSNAPSSIMGTTTGDMNNYDMHTFDYSHMGNGELGDGPYSAMLTANDTTHLNDVMMNDFMLSDATNHR